MVEDYAGVINGCGDVRHTASEAVSYFCISFFEVSESKITTMEGTGSAASIPLPSPILTVSRRCRRIGSYAVPIRVRPITSTAFAVEANSH